MQVACSGDLPSPPASKSGAINVSTTVPPRLRTSDDFVVTLFAKVRGVVGTQPIECGRHLLRRTSDGADASDVSGLEASLKCGIAAARAKQPFWTFRQERGIDSWIAQGLLGGADGVIQYFSYDSSPDGDASSDANARLTVSSCARPSVVGLQGYGRFSCGDGAQ
jgi:hypothetical protein